jgi:carbamoyltransferase
VYVLGFNAYVFNAAAWLFHDGEIVAAAQEERFNRRKHSGDFPEQAIGYCLNEAGISLDEVSHVGFHWRPLHQFHHRVFQIVRHLPDSLRYYDSHAGRWSQMVLVRRDLERCFPSRRRRPGYAFHRIRHPHCHAASAYYLSPFESAAVLTVDGSGEIASSTMGRAAGKRVRLRRQIRFPHSLGYLYVALTHYLGFIPDSDEYKVMALASLGEPGLERAFRRLVKLRRDGSYRLDLRYFNFHKGIREPWVSQRFIDTFGPLRRRGEPLEQRHMDIARALQLTLEETVLHMARHLHAETGERNLCYAGGTALNSVLNSRLLRDTPFDNVFIQPAANDAGTGAGSALTIWHDLLGKPRRGPMQHALYGPSFGKDRCRAALEAARIPFIELPEQELVSRTAELIDSGKIVGWFQGRMEVGPRALGARSILADPRRAEIKDILNERVKHREPFRPFAPSVIEEHACDWFEWDRPSPFMLHVVPIRPDRRARIPAVAHVDGSSRIQTVGCHANPRYRKLLDAFFERTGIPMLVNTSFNVMGEPIVCTPEDAVACFESTGLDVLVLGDFLVGG